MKKATNLPYVFESISDLHRVLELPKPEHPLVSVVNMEDIKCHFDDRYKSVVYNFYSICIKKNFKGTMKYGQSYYDFDEGTMTFFSPGQVISTIVDEDIALNGYWLILHPDFIRNYPLGKNIKNFGYFSYATNEALHLSEKEELMITGIMKDIEHEYRSVIDLYSQDVIVSHSELLLNYCNRFYNRQFITRQYASNDLLLKMEQILEDYFDNQKATQSKLPTVQFLAEQLNISPNYLSDMLRNLTGQNAQQHIHNKLIDKAKDILITTNDSISEIAYQLGFEYPQSFSKLFKSKTDVSPLAFRDSFN